MSLRVPNRCCLMRDASEGVGVQALARAISLESMP